jgi:hypothetical protein
MPLIQNTKYGLHCQVGSLIALLATALASVVIAAGCEGPWGPAPPSTGSLQTVYLPYVESVDIPDTVKAGEQFSYALHISTALGPALDSEKNVAVKTGVYSLAEARPKQGIVHTGAILHPYAYRFSLPSSVPDYPPPGTSITVPAVYSSAGLHYIYIASVKSREIGGTQATMWIGIEGAHVNDLDPALFEYREYAIEVTE